MPFSPQSAAELAASTLDAFVRMPPRDQDRDDTPFFRDLEKRRKNFGRGKEYIVETVFGGRDIAVQGWSADDKVNYAAVGNAQQAKYPFANTHCGFTVEYDLLQRNGISIEETAPLASPVRHSEGEANALYDILMSHMEKLERDRVIGHSDILWDDGTTDPKAPAGIRSIILDNPDSPGTTAGIDRQLYPYWRNRARTTGSADGILDLTTAKAEDGALINFFDQEILQLRRFGGRPHHAYCGSTFLNWLKGEIRVKGLLTQQGFAQDFDIGIGDVSYSGLRFIYEPWLDGNGYSNRCYVLDLDHLCLRTMENEWNKLRNPRRPHDQYVLYKAKTDVYGLSADQLNCHGVYEIATA